MVTVHFFVAEILGFVVGLLPQLAIDRFVRDKWYEPFVPGMALTAILLGYFLSRFIGRGRGAVWVWAIGFLFIAPWIYSGLQSKHGWDWMMRNIFGPTKACNETECMGELFATIPFVISVAYSIGALLRKLRTGSIQVQASE